MAQPAFKRPSFDELYASIAALAPGLTGEVLGAIDGERVELEPFHDGELALEGFWMSRTAA